MRGELSKPQMRQGQNQPEDTWNARFACVLPVCKPATAVRRRVAEPSVRLSFDCE